MSPGTAIADATYTEFDEAQASAYVDNRALLFQLWDLATTYPCIATKIEVRVRQADPEEDYAYEDSLADAAIIVELRWMDTADACHFLQCHNTYPLDGRGEHCDPLSEPRLFPSGDSSVMTSCEPGCFFLRNLKSQSNGTPLSARDVKTLRYSSNAHYVMSVRDGRYRRREIVHHDVAATALRRTTTPAVAVSGDGIDAEWTAPRPKVAGADLALFEYVRESDTCEIANAALVSFITQPWFRSATGDSGECRVTNFAIGEDIEYGARVDGATFVGADPTVDSATDRMSTTTGRIGSSYCAAFAKNFDPATRTCVVPWWETILSYTFLGTALVRLARHAVHGGDRCDEIFPASSSRPETRPAARDAKLLSRRDWFDDVDRSWCCPPPNVLLSDLGVFSRDQVWTNRGGGTVERAKPRDYGGGEEHRLRDYGSDVLPTIRPKRNTVAEQHRGGANHHGGETTSSRSLADTDARSIVRRMLQRRRRLGGGASVRRRDEPFIGAIRRDNVRRDKRSVAPSASSVSSSSPQPPLSFSQGGDGRFLDFDRVYSEVSLRSGETLNSDRVRAIAAAVSRDLGLLAANVVLEQWLMRLMKSAYNRALRFVGQRFAGTVSRTLLALSVRVATARMMSAALTGLSTRLMLALGTTATGVGAIITAVELLSFVLDLAIVFGWDPGNYQAEMQNDSFDALALTWLRARTREQVLRLDPYYMLYLYSSTYSRSDAAVVAEGGDGRDDSSEAVARPNERFVILSENDVPWFFAPFASATRVIIDDANGVSENESSSLDDDHATRGANCDTGDMPPGSRRRAMLSKRALKINFGGGDDPFGGGFHHRSSAASQPENITARVRPVISDSPAVCNMLWTVHYFAHRRINSNGQRVHLGGDGGDSVELSDEVVHGAVLDNELAAFLQASMAPAVPRERLVGAARRNIAAKSLRLLDHTVALLGFVLSAGLVGGLTFTVAPRIPLTAMVLLTLVLLLVAVPVVLAPAIVELFVPDGGTMAPGRTYERANERTDRDDLDRFCDGVVNAVFALGSDDNADEGATTTTAQRLRDFLLRYASRHIGPELRVLRESFDVDA